VLQAANTGAPLTATGVQALATLRASAKRDGRTVGRFGVGFAAVAAVADEVVVASRTGAVRFSRELTAQAVATLPSLAAELVARDGRVPLLRLPFESDAEPPRGWDTVVRVRVRPSARARVTALLDGLDATLLLVLPGLTRIELPGRVLAAVAEGADVVLDGARWRVLRGEGRLDEALLADRPVEERAATRWSVTWAVPVDGDGVPGPLPAGVAPVVRAPTPTDDPLSTPALLAATLPLGPDRRRVRPGPLTDAVLAAAGRVLAELLARLAPDPARLLLVPGPFAAGEVDAVLGRALLAALWEAPVLPGDRRPSDGLVLEDATDDLVAVLGDVLPGLLPAAWSGRRWTAALTALGTPRLDLAALTEVLAGIDRPPSWWRSVYAALPPDVEQLGALPVPLADGRLAAAPRGLVLTAAGDLSPLGLGVVHPEAAHPLLLRLGAVEAHPRTLLEDPRVRAAVENALDEDDPGPVVEAVLGLVGGAGVRPGELPWLAALPLPDKDGEWVPAGELLLPDGPLAQVVDRDAGFGVVQPGFAHDDVLAAVGVLRGFAVVPVDEADGVDGLPEWLGTLLPGQEPEAVVRDLDLVRPESWPLALDVLRRDDLLRLPYVRWWLAVHPVAGGRRPADLRLPGSDPLLEGLYDEAPAGLVVGVRTSLAEVLADEPTGLLDRLADPARELSRVQVRAVHAALAAAGPDVDPPEAVRAVDAGTLTVVPAEDAVCVERPDLLARVAPYAVVPVPLSLAAELADVLDLALASEVVPAVALRGRPQPWAEVVPAVLAPVAGRVVTHDRLVVPAAGGHRVEVGWVADGEVDHVVGSEGMALALAWRSGRWERRHALAALLRGADDDGAADLDEL